MNHYQTFLFVTLAIVLIIALFVIKVRNKRRILLWSSWILFVPLFLPRQWWGQWNAIKILEGKKISKLVFVPSTPGWEVNLTDSLTVISDTSEINELLGYLQKTEVYFPGHPIRIWETNLIVVTTANDSIHFNIQRTENNGTVIYTPNDKWRKDEVGPLIERMVNYRHPWRGAGPRLPGSN
jgi:hypothetical protein